MPNKIKKAHIYYVYILANKRNGTLYIGVTKDLFNRSFQHKSKQNIYSFTAKYNVDKLVYFEEYQYIGDAILREKQLKKWNRQWKIKLIEKDNPTWCDLLLNMLYITIVRLTPGFPTACGFGNDKRAICFIISKFLS